MKDFLKDRGYVDGKDQVTKFPNLMNLVNPFNGDWIVRTIFLR